MNERGENEWLMIQLCTVTMCITTTYIHLHHVGVAYVHISQIPILATLPIPDPAQTTPPQVPIITLPLYFVIPDSHSEATWEVPKLGGT